jgi:hypothetical protein
VSPPPWLAGASDDPACDADADEPVEPHATSSRAMAIIAVMDWSLSLVMY